ncbi:hypothetical protein C8Q80DRAFT_907605 [Daedaleopsis nitida]|nr:hypothetical protein C8Q80DRAFT_907605 [Daedaleopsis nitida]
MYGLHRARAPSFALTAELGLRLGMGMTQCSVLSTQSGLVLRLVSSLGVLRRQRHRHATTGKGRTAHGAPRAQLCRSSAGMRQGPACCRSAAGSPRRCVRLQAVAPGRAQVRVHRGPARTTRTSSSVLGPRAGLRLRTHCSVNAPPSTSASFPGSCFPWHVHGPCTHIGYAVQCAYAIPSPDGPRTTRRRGRFLIPRNELRVTSLKDTKRLEPTRSPDGACNVLRAAHRAPRSPKLATRSTNSKHAPRSAPQVKRCTVHESLNSSQVSSTSEASLLDSRPQLQRGRRQHQHLDLEDTPAHVHMARRALSTQPERDCTEHAQTRPRYIPVSANANANADADADDKCRHLRGLGLTTRVRLSRPLKYPHDIDIPIPGQRTAHASRAPTDALYRRPRVPRASSSPAASRKPASNLPGLALDRR